MLDRAGTIMKSAEAPERIVRRRERRLRNIIRGAPLALAFLLGCASTVYAAGLLGSSHGGPLPSLPSLPSPGTGSLRALGWGSTPEAGTIIGPSLSIPLSPSTGALGNPIAGVPDI